MLFTRFDLDANTCREKYFHSSINWIWEQFAQLTNATAAEDQIKIPCRFRTEFDSLSMRLLLVCLSEERQNTSKSHCDNHVKNAHYSCYSVCMGSWGCRHSNHTAMPPTRTHIHLHCHALFTWLMGANVDGRGCWLFVINECWKTGVMNEWVNWMIERQRD